MSSPFQTKKITFENKSIPIISVGSGMGKREKELINLGYKVICIDPTKQNKDRWYPIKRVMKSNYKYVNDLIENNKDIIGNCNLLIEYPMTDYITYDFCAIYDLQPIEIIILTTVGATSGSILLHYWLNKYGINTTNKQITMKSLAQGLGITFNIELNYELEIIDTMPKKCIKFPDTFIFVKGKRKFEICNRNLLSQKKMEEHMEVGVPRTLEILKLNQ